MPQRPPRPPVPTLARLVASYLPTRSSISLARRLITRANAERDARRWQAASILYEEALRLVPGNPRFHIQCGHMHKEAGDYASAEHHYVAALKLIPDDPDLALQLGHFYKTTGRLDEAEQAYRHATALRPGWSEAEEELARVAGAAGSLEAGTDFDALAPELLPGSAAPASRTLREGIHVRRLGATRTRTRGGYRRVLRGIEAIHGFVISPAKLAEIVLALDGEIVLRSPLRHDSPSADRPDKHVFNVWHDFSDLPPGPRQAELRATDSLGITRIYRALIDIAPPLSEADHPGSDTIVGPLPPGAGSLEERINLRPSMVRPARRALLDRSPRAILVQRVDQLGDLVCSIPALRRLRDMFPAARIVLLVTAANVELARTIDLIDEVVVADFREEIGDGRKVMTLAAQEALSRELARYRFDLAIDLGETSGSRPLLHLSGAPFLYGFKDREFPWLTAGFELYTHDPGNHQEMAAHPRKLLALIEGLGAIAGGAGAPLPRPDLNRGMLAGYGLAPATRYAVLHAGARLAYSRWPGYAELARMLLDRTDLTVVVMGDEPLAGLPDSDRLIPLFRRMPFDHFDALLGFCAVFVGNDSGPKHLAALRGAPVVSLHMARLNWNEWGQDVSGAIVSRRVPCAGCGIGGDAEDCGKDFACIRYIRADEVFAAMTALL